MKFIQMCLLLIFLEACTGTPPIIQTPLPQPSASSDEITSNFTSTFRFQGCVLSHPPIYKNYDLWYVKYCNAAGLPILASKNVSDVAMKQAYYVIMTMFEKTPQYRQNLINSSAILVIYNDDEESIESIPSLTVYGERGSYDYTNRMIVTWEDDLLCNNG